MIAEKKGGLLRGLAFILALVWVVGLVIGLTLGSPYAWLAGGCLAAAYTGGPIVAILLSVHLGMETKKAVSVVVLAFAAPAIVLPILGLMQNRVKKKPWHIWGKTHLDSAPSHPSVHQLDGAGTLGGLCPL